MHQRRRRHNANESLASQHRPLPEQHAMSSSSTPQYHDLEVDYASTTSTSSLEEGSADKTTRTLQVSSCCITYTNAGFYVLSGCSQPLIMTLLKQAGIADPSCQAYMLFYYLFPAAFILPVILNNDWPRRATIFKAFGIATWDIASTSMNYTGASVSAHEAFCRV